MESESKIAGLLQELTDERALNSKLNQEKVQLSAQLDQLRNEKSTFPNPPTTIKCDKMTETEKEDLSKSEMKSFSFEVGCQTNSSSTFDLESKILQLETKLGERETFFSKVVKQLQISTQFERQLLRDNFQKVGNSFLTLKMQLTFLQEILERDYKLREFENDIKLLLKQLSLFQETS